MIDFLEYFRSLGFGALLGAGIFGLIYLFVPGSYTAAVSIETFMIIGGLTGGGLHRFCDALIVNTFLRPIGGFISYYSKLIQIVFLHRVGMIDRKTRRELINELTRIYVLGNSRKTPRLPPP